MPRHVPNVAHQVGVEARGTVLRASAGNRPPGPYASAQAGLRASIRDRDEWATKRPSASIWSAVAEPVQVAVHREPGTIQITLRRK